MEYTIYLDISDQVDVSVYKVKLASENPSLSYGILDVTSDSAVVPWGTEILPYDTGKYSYTLSIENGHIYHVSWEITMEYGKTPSYKTEYIGPVFFINDSNIRATATFRGKFIQGNLATLMLKITNFDGIPQDPKDISISIYDADGVIVSLDNSTPEQAATGFYIYDWNIDSDQTPGEYTVIWNYIVEDVEKAEVQNIVVSTDATDTLYYSGRVYEFRLALEHHLSCAQSIPVYYEQAKPSRDNKTFYFTFKNWNQSADVKIYRNGKIVNEGVEVDFFYGKVVFDTALMEQETVHADYNFRWFKDEDLDRFLANSVQTVNIYPPASAYSLLNVPDRFIPAVLYGASKDALRQLMMCLQFQQPQQVFGGADQSQKAFQGFDTLKQNYEKDWEKLLEQKKLGPYPRTSIVSTPEYTLPGGRSRWFRMLFKN